MTDLPRGNHRPYSRDCCAVRSSSSYPCCKMAVEPNYEQKSDFSSQTKAGKFVVPVVNCIRGNKSSFGKIN